MTETITAVAETVIPEPNPMMGMSQDAIIKTDKQSTVASIMEYGFGMFDMDD